MNKKLHFLIISLLILIIIVISNYKYELFCKNQESLSIEPESYNDNLATKRFKGHIKMNSYEFNLDSKKIEISELFNLDTFKIELWQQELKPETKDPVNMNFDCTGFDSNDPESLCSSFQLTQSGNFITFNHVKHFQASEDVIFDPINKRIIARVSNPIQYRLLKDDKYLLICSTYYEGGLGEARYDKITITDTLNPEKEIIIFPKTLTNYEIELKSYNLEGCNFNSDSLTYKVNGIENIFSFEEIALIESHESINPQILKNEEYGFQVEYPNNWEFIVGNKQKIFDYSGSFSEINQEFGSLATLNIKSDQSLEEYIEELIANDIDLLSRKTININNVEWIELIIKEQKTPLISYILLTRNKEYIYGFHFRKDEKELYLNVVDVLLNQFSFISSTNTSSL